jgi:proteic killer suppression protein
VIKSFKCRETHKIWQRKFSKKLPQNIQLRARRKLIAIDISTSLTDLKIPPSNKLEPLSGDRQGQYSIRVNDQWRICFVWSDSDAYDVEIVDYH